MPTEKIHCLLRKRVNKGALEVSSEQVFTQAFVQAAPSKSLAEPALPEVQGDLAVGL